MPAATVATGNVVVVTQTVTVAAAPYADHQFVAGDRVAPSSPYYWPLIWAGYVTDSGDQYATNLELAFQANHVVVSDVDPDLGSLNDVWIQTFPNGDWTMWIEDGT